MNLNKIFFQKKKKWRFWIILFFTGLFMWLALGAYESKLSNTAAKLTNLIVGNGWNIRSYNEQGIPYSHIARLKKKVISPYYVVHYGLIYSQSVAPPAYYEWLWQKDQSFKYWNEEPHIDLVTKNNFIHATEWIMQRLGKDKYGNIHIFYNFPWPYEGTSSGYLLPPWHSGLTDAVAIKLFLRAYAVTNENCYLDAASSLYYSVLRPINKGGALVSDQYGNPWIEEYIAQNNTKPPFVLNGMIYATLAIMDYEKFMGIHTPISSRLIESIKKRLPEYDTGYWTRYDLIGNLANKKYHNIHIELMNILYQQTKDPFFELAFHKWKKYKTHFFTRYFIKGHPTINSLVVLSLVTAAWLVTTSTIYIALTVFPVLFKLIFESNINEEMLF